jgi:hypothetical protein
MKYEVQESDNKGDYIASAIDHEGEGKIYSALFSGPNAKERAEAYAAWKNSETDMPKVAPQGR